MANRSLGSLTLNLIAQIGGYTGPLSQAEQATANFSANLRKSFAGLTAASAALVTGAGATFAVMVKNSIDAQDELSKASQKIGVSVEDLSKLSYAADLSDVAFENLTGSLAKFNKGLAEAYSTGSGAVAEALQDLGISATDSSGRLKSTNDVFIEVADRLSGLQDGAIKTSLAMELFGKSGADLIPLLNSGKTGLAQMADEAQQLGQVLSTDAAKKAEEFNDNLTRLQKTFSGVANAVAMEALPELAEFSEKIKDPAFQEGLAAIAKGLVNITATIAGSVSAFIDFSNFLGEEFASKINGIASDDIPRLEARLYDLQKALAPQNGSNNILTGVKITDAIKSVEELEKERDAILKNIAAYQLYQDQKAKTDSLARPKNDIGEDPFALTPEQREAEITNNRKLRELGEQKAKDAKKQADERFKQVEQLQKAFENELSTLQREIDLYGEVSRVQSVAFELEKGNLAALSDPQKEKLLNLAAMVDLRERDAAAIEKQKEAESAEAGKKEQIDDLIKQQQRSIDLEGESSKAAQIEYDIRHGILEVVGGINSAQAKVLINQAAMIDAQEKFKEASTLSEKAIERIDEAAADIWLNMGDGFESFRDSVFGSFKKLLAEMAHEALTKPILLKVQQSLSDGIGGALPGGANLGGLYAAGTLAVVSAIDSWNAKQDERIRKLSAEYKQQNQSLSKALGEGTKKSDTIANGIMLLSRTDKDVLDVNYKMLVSLEGIRAGIQDVAAGFAKTLTGSGNYKAMGIQEGVTRSKPLDNLLGGFGLNDTVANLFGDDVGGFITGVLDSASKALYNKKKKVIDSGINILGVSLSDILSGASIEAFNYADVNTTKKVLGIKTSSKNKRQTEELSDVFEQQITDVFAGAAGALRDASEVFGIDFEKYVGDLRVTAQDISLKGLEGEELTKEIEAFFSKTLDDWAGVLLGAGNERILEDFQAIGESAFDTMLRLAAETRTFAKYADVLALNFSAMGVDAVYATQAIADFSGGFDDLANSLSTYYDRFFTDSEKFAAGQEQLSKAFTELGYVLPTTRDGFKNLVSGLDLATEADQKRFAGLIKLSGATDDYLTSLERETESKKAALKASAGAAFDDLTKVVDKQREAVQGQIDSASEALNATKAVAASLSSALKSMTLESTKNELAVRRAAQAEIITAAAIAKAGGGLPKEGQLDDALAIVARPSQDLYASFEDYAREFYTTTKNIKDLAAATGEQQTTEEKNLEVLNSQLTALDELVKFYQLQIEKLDDIDGGIVSITDSIRNLTDVLTEAGVSTDSAPNTPTLAYDYENRQATQSNTLAANNTAIGNGVYVDLVEKVTFLTEQLSASQFAIAKNTMNTAKILQRWDADGMPLETVS